MKCSCGVILFILGSCLCLSHCTLMYSDDIQQALLSSRKHCTVSDQKQDRSGNEGKAKLK